MKRHHNSPLLWLIALLLTTSSGLLAAAPVQAGTLDDIRKEVRENDDDDEREERPSRPAHRSPHRSRHHSYHHGHSRHSCHSTCHHYHHGHHHDFGTAMRVLFSPFWGPWVVVEKNEIQHPAYSGHPYQKGYSGYIQDDPKGSRNAFSMTLEGGIASYGFNQTIDARLTLARRFELELVAQRMVEPTAPTGEDSLVLLQPQLNAVFAMGRHALFRTGIGVNTLVDPQSKPVQGINFHYDMDFFPVKPLVLSIRLGAGTLGEASLTQARMTAGLTLYKVEFYGGYDSQWIGDQSIGGPIAGARLWF